MDWILVKHGTVELIRAAIISHAEIIVPETPQTFTVRITPLVTGGHAVTFDDKPPPYEFANLIGWLNDPPEIPDVSDAVGWYTSRSSGTRYFLRPDDVNEYGDTLVGAAPDGTSISVYLPELSVCEISSPVAYVADADRVDAEPVSAFEIAVEINESFGNPGFELTHDRDARW